ncbi:MAG TPA: DUF72 domain-containing protein [Thermoplasmata archaeon]|nr:DUF72 domain-containing protein [Thermoplasmata archaeon]
MGRTLLLGTSGWEYPEWVGRVYPTTGATDHLRYYTRLFPIVEINTTFYRTPPVATVESWARRTPAGFRFAAKFPRTITHDRRLEGAGVELAGFLGAIAPLRESGKLAAALLQLPPSLPFDPRTVRRFYETIPADLPVAVEFREVSWLADESLALLKEFRFAAVVVDEPRLPVRLDVTGPFAYVRWHGHGSRIWYDYTYSREELQSWVPRIQELVERAGTVYGFFNNHFRGDAATNCRTLEEMLGLPPPPWSSRLPV